MEQRARASAPHNHQALAHKSSSQVPRVFRGRKSLPGHMGITPPPLLRGPRRGHAWRGHPRAEAWRGHARRGHAGAHLRGGGRVGEAAGKLVAPACASAGCASPGWQQIGCPGERQRHQLCCSCNTCRGRMQPAPALTPGGIMPGGGPPGMPIGMPIGGGTGWVQQRQAVGVSPGLPLLKHALQAGATAASRQRQTGTTLPPSARGHARPLTARAHARGHHARRRHAWHRRARRPHLRQRRHLGPRHHHARGGAAHATRWARKPRGRLARRWHRQAPARCAAHTRAALQVSGEEHRAGMGM